MSALERVRTEAAVHVAIIDAVEGLRTVQPIDQSRVASLRSELERVADLVTGSSGYRILGPDDAARLTTQIAQLRHAYAHLNAGRVTDQRQFANGLIHPAIAALEEALCATHQRDK